MTIRPGWDCVTVPADGADWNQGVALAVIRPEVKLTGVLLVLCTVTVCEPGGSAPATAVQINPEGWTIGPRLLPGGRDVRITDTICGSFVAPVAETCTRP